MQIETPQTKHSDQEGICPISGTKGKRVNTATVKCLLAVSLREVHDIQYYFCRDANCPVVYFSSDGTQLFNVSEVREQVYQKQPDSDSVLVCYCFRYTLGNIREATANLDAKSIVNEITTGIQAGQCACDWRNPQGDCCLGNVRALIKQYRSETEANE